MRHTEKECGGTHCRCMGGNCTENHYSDHQFHCGHTPVEHEENGCVNLTASSPHTQDNKKCCPACRGNSLAALPQQMACRYEACDCHTPTEKKCVTSPNCSHNTNGRDRDKPCSIEFRPSNTEKKEFSGATFEKKVVAKAIESMDKQVGGAVRRLSDSNSEWEKKFDKELGHMFFFKDFSREIAIEFIRTLLTSERERILAEWGVAHTSPYEEGRTQALSEVLALIEGMKRDVAKDSDQYAANPSKWPISVAMWNAALSDLRTTIINKQKSV